MAIPEIWLIGTIFIFGLLIGSFLNVVIWRVPRKLSVAHPVRSFCTSCEAQLAWKDNIPVLSWLLLGTKCRHCRAPISGQYPLVELSSGIAAVAAYIYFGLSPTMLVIYALSATLIAITFIDFEFKIIPNVISYPGIIIGLAIGVLSQFSTVFASPPITQDATDSLIGLLSGGGFFWVLGEAYYFCTKREGLGGGDIKLMAMTGAILGWRSIAPTIFAGSLCGAIVGLSIMFFRGGNRQLEIPFGPWLSLGVLLYIFADLPFLRFP